MFDKRETQSGTALRAAVGNIDPVKSLGQTRKMLRRNSRAIVPYCDARFRLAGPRLCPSNRDVNALADSPVLEGVLNKVFERPDQLVTVAEHRERVWRQRDLDFDPAVAREHLKAVNDLLHDRRQIDRSTRLQMCV